MKEQYIFTKTVADIILDIKGAVIFGGYIRDQILHDHAAKKFYESTLDEYLDRSKYNDRLYLPELADRCLIANDIDCLMSDDNINLLEKSLNNHGLKFLRGADAPLTFYTNHENNLSNQNLKVLHACVMFNISDRFDLIIPSYYRKMIVKLDIIHTNNIDDIEPPFGVVDFACNTLIMDNSKQIRISTNILKDLNGILERLNYLNKIIDDIVNKRACILNLVYVPHKFRITKMINKGFSIISPFKDMIITPKFINPTPEDICLICHEDFYNKPFCKRECCAAIYHCECLAKSVKVEGFKDECPMCRKFTSASSVRIIKVF